MSAKSKRHKKSSVVGSALDMALSPSGVGYDKHFMMHGASSNPLGHGYNRHHHQQQLVNYMTGAGPLGSPFMSSAAAAAAQSHAAFADSGYLHASGSLVGMMAGSLACGSNKFRRSVELWRSSDWIERDRF